MNRSLRLLPAAAALLVTGLLLLPAMAQAGPRHSRSQRHDHHRVHQGTLHGRVVIRPLVVAIGPPAITVRRSSTQLRVMPRQNHVIQRRYDDWMLLSHRSFLEVADAMDSAPFSSDKLAIIRDVARGWLLTTDQAAELAQKVVFSDDRLEALATMYPSIIDPENFYRTYELLPFSDDRAELRRRTGRW
jgi:hypothetical protein